jgi:hypothetical protein
LPLSLVSMGLILKYSASYRASKFNFGFHHWRVLTSKIGARQRNSCPDVRRCGRFGDKRHARGGVEEQEWASTDGVIEMKFRMAQGKDGGSVVKPSPFDLVETYSNFWAGEQAAAEQRMEDQAILRAALKSMAAETQRRLPIPWQISIYEALRTAETTKRQFLAEQSRRAGSAEKTDALQMFIIEAMRANRPITAVELLDKLRQAQQPGGLIEDIDEEVISFVDVKGRGKTARVSGLKDRLFRARKKLDRRIEKGESR